MTNCTLLQTTESFLSRKTFKAAEPALPAIIDVTPVTVPAVAHSNERALVSRAPAPIAFLQVKPKARRASKKSAAQSFVELLIAAASLLFLAMT